MKTTSLLALVPAAVLASAAFVSAEDANRIAVSVKGAATATADTVEVEFTISARADESADAEKKYRGKLATLLTALKEGKAAAKPAKKEKPSDPAAEKPAKKKKADEDEDDDEPAKKPAKEEKKADEPEPADAGGASAIPYEVVERGLTFGVKAGGKDDQNPFKAIARMNGGPAPGADPPFLYSSKVVAVIKGVKKLDPKLVARRVAQLTDLGIDSGADGTDSATAPTMKFVVDDLEALRTKAYEDAMAKAKARCEKLATLGGRKLGPVATVREGGAGKIAEDLQTMQLKAVSNMFGSSSGSDAAPGGFDVTTEIELAVEFELVSEHHHREHRAAKAAEDKAASGEHDGLVKALEELRKAKESNALNHLEYGDAVKKLVDHYSKKK